MSTLLRAALLALLLSLTSLAAESEAAEPNIQFWKWANFLVLAGALTYVILKNAGPFFEARSRQIRKDMIESEQIKSDAEARAADVDRRRYRQDPGPRRAGDRRRLQGRPQRAEAIFRRAGRTAR